MRFLYSILVAAHLSNAIPMLILTSPRPYCLAVEGPIDTVARISYEVPEFAASDPESMVITVNVRPWNRVYHEDLHEAPVREHLKPHKETIDQAKASILYEFPVDGTADICLQATSAQQNKPIAAGLRVETSYEIPSLAKRPKATADVDTHLTHMETELVRISGAMEQLLREAHLNQEQDEHFHEQTLAMHSATTFWPIVQLCVLLMTGFTQASHIVRFFKSRRLI